MSTRARVRSDLSRPETPSPVYTVLLTAFAVLGLGTAVSVFAGAGVVTFRTLQNNLQVAMSSTSVRCFAVFFSSLLVGAEAVGDIAVP